LENKKMNPGKDDPQFIGSKADPSRAEAVSDVEYARLAEELKTVVLLLLCEAAAGLAGKRFRIVKLACEGGLASLVVRTPRPAGIQGWIYFQIHRTFGPLLASERVFWMYAVQNPNGTAGKPGRLKDLTDSRVVAGIIDDFVALCEEHSA
jgi:hypothetical protein